MNPEQNLINIDGFYTKEHETELGDKVGFDLVDFYGNVTPFARNEEYCYELRNVDGIQYNGLHIDLKTFEDKVVPKVEEAFFYFIRKENANKVNIMVLDELGRMELLSPRFREILKKLVE